MNLVRSCRSGYFFFFQAEDGIRDLTVTGVQTCALPISQLCAGAWPLPGKAATYVAGRRSSIQIRFPLAGRNLPPRRGLAFEKPPARASREIGRASCRERV